MNSRDRILQAVWENKPEEVDLPVLDFTEVIIYEDVVRQFMGMVESAGGSVVCLDSRNRLEADLAEAERSGRQTVRLLDPGDGAGLAGLRASDLEGVQKCYLRSRLGVAENGALWLGERDMEHRLVPFICQELVLVLDPGEIVGTMHEAYRRLPPEEGFGVFVAGPSKTADIEQSLVIGAHGPRSLTVYLIDPV